MIQFIIVYIAILAALMYASYRIWKYFSNQGGVAGNSCGDCSGCALAELKKHGHNSSCSSNRKHKAKAGSREEQESAPSKDSKSGFVHKNEEKADKE